MTSTTIISPSLLHKDSADDVLLTRPRKVVPSRLVSPVTGEHPDGGVAGLEHLYESAGASARILRTAPARGFVTGQPFADVAKEDVIRGVPHQVIDSLRAPVSVPVGDDAIERFLTHHGVSARSTSFEFVNLADHYFFYRKRHEHVPGIMLLEAARQAIYYQLYTYSEHALGKVTVSLSGLNAKFHGYAELMYPIEIVVDDLTETDDLQPCEVRYASSFYQRGALIARIESVAPVIRLDKFRLARNACLFDTEYFAPVPSAPVISLLTSDGAGQSIVSLRKIGKQSCVTSAAKIGNTRNALLTVIYDGNICFKAPVTHAGQDEDGVTWDFGHVEYAELERLKEMIKRGFTVC
ncbi:AfsA-related hotdog domain-containing protein [Burkholderia ambifaria]|uniref:AfsA-related hotdog domain-containing protein n=1 Tax=Burkholderia ambifaria TaxID=152480 RepID=UPI0015888DDD|nr:AfsA-related hotdog domain-containing protein [Burkholderia ambifaria]